MPANMIMLPFPRKLYNDIVRFSDGRIDLSGLAENLIINWVENSLEFGAGDEWGDRAEEVAEEYAPRIAELWRKQDAEAWAERQKTARPLVWKEVTIPNGSQVRMFYGKDHSYAEVRGGKIVDGDQTYSPSEWASKVANGTSRNAWRDLWFKLPTSKAWIPATILREQAREARVEDAS